MPEEQKENFSDFTLSGLSVQLLVFVIEPTHICHEPLVRFLYNFVATVYLVNPGRVRKFAEGIGILRSELNRQEAEAGASGRGRPG
jgi:hypothetical protein